jgi:hypothetical protein
MAKKQRIYTPEFQQQMVELALTGRLQAAGLLDGTDGHFELRQGIRQVCRQTVQQQTEGAMGLRAIKVPGGERRSDVPWRAIPQPPRGCNGQRGRLAL